MAGRRVRMALIAALCAALSMTVSMTGRAESAGSGPGNGPGNGPGAGEAVGPVTKLPLPRYVSLRSSRVNARRGPGLDYRIDWVFQRAGLPVRIVDEYGHWRRIVDSDEAGGWVYHSLLAGRRTALVTASEVTLRAEPAEGARARATAERGVVATLLGCRAEWCELEAEGASGWVPKAAIWGAGEEREPGG